jgi:hypothetical protein
LISFLPAASVHRYTNKQKYQLNQLNRNDKGQKKKFVSDIQHTYVIIICVHVKQKKKKNDFRFEHTIDNFHRSILIESSIG